MTRRDLAWLFPLLASLPSDAAETAPAHSRVFRFTSLPVNANPNGNVTRPVLKGQLPTGEYIEVHETSLAPGNLPHPPHRHKHTELMLLRTGTLQLLLADTHESLAPGDIAWCASDELHGIKNNGPEPANYFVIAIGPDIA